MVGVVAVVSALIGPVPVASAGAAARTPNTDPYVPPSETVTPPNTDNCGQRTRPPAAVDTSEDVPPGAPAVTPLPVPAKPVGGGRLGECGLIVPKGAPPLPSDISAGAWLIADLDSGEVLAAKDPHGRYRPASTLKLLTAQVMLKNLKDLKKVVVGTTTDTQQDGTRVGIEAGGKYTVQQLLTYLIIISGNDAANALARANGGYDKTIADMNATAKALGALDTRAATVSGLDGPGQSTSAYDLALFAKADMATPPFPEIVSSVDVRVPSAGGQGYIAANDNQLLYQYKGALGGKTGFTDDAGNTYVGMAERDGRRLVVTMLNGTQQPRRQWMQAASLLDWGFALPAKTPPVGKLVDSLAEATAAAAPATPSTPPPSAGTSGASSASGSAPGAASMSTGTPAAAVSTSGSSSTAWLIAAVAALAAIVAGAFLWLRDRSRRRPVFAGDAAPAGVTTGSTTAGSPTDSAPTQEPPGHATAASPSDTAPAQVPPGLASGAAAGDPAANDAAYTDPPAGTPADPPAGPTPGTPTPTDPAPDHRGNPEPPPATGLQS
jgi:D-alanyl-D-alanine carboxypeptidase (penicillin-binding protein 5/6)